MKKYRVWLDIESEDEDGNFDRQIAPECLGVFDSLEEAQNFVDRCVPSYQERKI